MKSVWKYNVPIFYTFREISRQRALLVGQQDHINKYGLVNIKTILASSNVLETGPIRHNLPAMSWKVWELNKSKKYWKYTMYYIYIYIILTFVDCESSKFQINRPSVASMNSINWISRKKNVFFSVKKISTSYLVGVASTAVGGAI